MTNGELHIWISGRHNIKISSAVPVLHVGIQTCHTLSHFYNVLQEDQLGLSLLTLEQVQSEEFQKKIQQAAMEVS